MVGIGAFRVFMRTRLYIEPRSVLFSLGQTPKLILRSCSCQSRDTSCDLSSELSIKLGLRNYDPSQSFKIAGSVKTYIFKLILHNVIII